MSIDVLKHEKGKRHSNNKETIWLELVLLYDLKMNNQVIDIYNIKSEKCNLEENGFWKLILITAQRQSLVKGLARRL